MSCIPTQLKIVLNRVLAESARAGTGTQNGPPGGAGAIPHQAPPPSRQRTVLPSHTDYPDPSPSPWPSISPFPSPSPSLSPQPFAIPSPDPTLVSGALMLHTPRHTGLRAEQNPKRCRICNGVHPDARASRPALRARRVMCMQMQGANISRAYGV